MLTAINGTGGQDRRAGNGQWRSVTITGTSSNPIITPDVGGLMKNNSQQLVNSLGSLFGGKKKN